MRVMEKWGTDDNGVAVGTEEEGDPTLGEKEAAIGCSRFSEDEERVP